ncbi:MAG: DUF434 domain-containing protein [Candidatus Hydrogenedentes bacterium]|nr:DUF434 domain-containing protein [Candidatus Hydrogenedentota bacterium]
MPQRQHHRGRHPEDGRLFAPQEIGKLRNAVHDLSFLQTRGYAETAALKLTGDHYQLDARQRRAVLGASCSDSSLVSRGQRMVNHDSLRGERLAVDGYNLLISTESLLAGGIVLRGRDGCIRDLASVHGSYRKVDETAQALQLIGDTMQSLGVEHVDWLLDAPVSNSGRLRQMMMALAANQGWPWEVHLAANVDKSLAASHDVVVTSDGWILDRAPRWARITELMLERVSTPITVIDLGNGGFPPGPVSRR